MTRKTCKQCGHKWSPRVANPRACPKCKSYEWNKLSPAVPPGEDGAGKPK